MYRIFAKAVMLFICATICVSIVACGKHSEEQVEEQVSVIKNQLDYDTTAVYDLVKTDTYNGGAVSVLPDAVKNYLKLFNDEKALAKYLYEYDEVFRSAGAPKPVKLYWITKPNTEYTFVLSQDENFNQIIYTECTQGNSVEIKNIIPGKYYWKVFSSDGLQSITDSFVVDEPIRLIDCGNITNFRDEGGYVGEFGKVKYGLAYRSARFDEADEDAVKVLTKDLKIKTELDVRIGDTHPSVDESINKCVYGFWQFDYMFPNIGNPNRTFQQSYADGLRQGLKLFTDIKNYPIVFHCTAGADRTGTFSFLLNGLLGVGYEDLTRDFEITTFYQRKRWRSAINVNNGVYSFDESGVCEDNVNTNLVAFGKMYKHVMEEYGTGDGKLSSAICNYLVSVVKLTEDDIEAIRKNMIEGYGENESEGNSENAEKIKNAPQISETHVLDTTDGNIILLTAITDTDYVYEAGYEITGDAEIIKSDKDKCYTYLPNNNGGKLTAGDIFGQEYADARLVVWKINSEKDFSYNAYVKYGYKDGDTLKKFSSEKSVKNTVKEFVADSSGMQNDCTVSIETNNGEYGSTTSSSFTVKRGTAISVSGNIVKIGNKAVLALPYDNTYEYSYKFIEFEVPHNVIDGNLTIRAVFERKVNEYNVIFNNYDGTELQSTIVPYGEMPEYKGVNPKKPFTNGTYFVFVGWDKELSEVKSDAVYTAVFEERTFKLSKPLLENYEQGHTIELPIATFEDSDCLVSVNYGGNPVDITGGKLYFANVGEYTVKYSVAGDSELFKEFFINACASLNVISSTDNAATCTVSGNYHNVSGWNKDTKLTFNKIVDFTNPDGSYFRNLFLAPRLAYGFSTSTFDYISVKLTDYKNSDNVIEIRLADGDLNKWKCELYYNGEKIGTTKKVNNGGQINLFLKYAYREGNVAGGELKYYATKSIWFGGVGGSDPYIELTGFEGFTDNKAIITVEAVGWKDDIDSASIGFDWLMSSRTYTTDLTDLYSDEN